MVRAQLRIFQHVVGFLDKGTSVNISFATRKRQILQGKVLEFFSEIIFQLSKKGRGDLPLSLPPPPGGCASVGKRKPFIA